MFVAAFFLIKNIDPPPVFKALQESAPQFPASHLPSFQLP
jgi:hypothetical protein